MKIKLDIEPLNNWVENSSEPLMIAGPCSAESEEQLVTTAHEINKLGKVNIFRAGIWKPRTRPGSFEGVGEEGLKWMKRVKDETGMRVITEVANPEHVEACLNHGIKMMWIGARTSANPFSVQAIADILKGTDTVVLVKNPVNPDLQLWIGALERINKAGVAKIAAIHRGFSAFDGKPFRNSPMWSIPIELKVACPGLPIICDPSHITGNRELVSFISQKAMDLDMEGLMIETHLNPDAAISDAKQQITPRALKQLMVELKVREPSSQNSEFRSKLENLRHSIDELDEEIVQKLSERMKISEQIGQYKKNNNVTILQVNRWDSILNQRTALGKAIGMDEEFMKKYLQLIHQESIRIQNEIMNK